MYESTVIPTDTMMPVTPASVSDDLDIEDHREYPRDQRVERGATEQEPGDHDETEEPVVEEHVERDQREPEEPGDDPGVELVLAERRRDVLHADLLELHGQRAVVDQLRQVLGVTLR